MDQAGRSYTYEVVENNLGLEKVVATVKVVPVGADSCAIVWSSVTEPPPGWTVSDYTNYLQSAASETAKKVGEVLRAGDE
ncbi:lachrymatory-factor synthase [Iris pallida]|uniref:Lachrymatory-factor synthase n=1 Tax=Iris pallida TaxID=29817 RepID=A0AAX6FZ80_IRIPA|nr:lachrymatory-factor synthase [Iris pallida]